MAFLRMKTSDEHVMADVYSCFQKYVRRGDFAEAVYWGSQIAVARGEFKGYPNALKKRMMQHALEDVGSLEYAVNLYKAKVDTWESLLPWIEVLCDLPKTRACAWFNRLAVEHVANPEAAPTPALRRGAEALVLHRDGKKKELAEIYSKDVMNLYKELNSEVLAFHADTLSSVLPNVTVPAPKTSVEVPAARLVKREVPDWAYDKHTAKGKAQGRGYEHFFETMITAPRLISGDDMFEKEAKALYLNGKEQRVRHILAASDTAKATAKAEEKAKKAEEKKAAKAEEKAKKAEEKKAAKAEEKAKEKARKAEEKKAAKESAKAAGPQYVPDTAPPAEYMNVLQIQPITGRSKPRVWFATAPDGKQVVIKGPLKADEVLANINSEVAKKTLGLPSVNLHAEEVDGKTYLVSDNLLGDRTAFLPTRTVTTKLEKDVRVVDVEKATLSTWEHEMLNDDEKARNLLVALAFRKVIGANDTCNRNLVVVGNAVYSVDDPALHKETPYMWSKALVKPKTSYEAALEKHWDHVVKVLESWKAKVDEEGKKQIDALSAKDGWKW